MTYEIPLQDGKQITKLQADELWGYDPQGTYGEHATPEEKQKHLLKVSDNPAHSIYFREYGNPKGEPVVVVHGGPGGGCSIEDAKFLDPKRYRIILFDQRGNGNSEPTVADGSSAALEGNNTAELIEDIVKLRDHLGIKGKMHLFGGSWGSTLSLAYAIEHPEHVKSLMLRGIFLGRRNVFDYFYQGNAATYDTTKPLAEQDFSNPPGAYRAYLGSGEADALLPGQIPAEHRTPTMAKAYEEFWRDFVTVIPPEKRGDMVAAYSEIFEMKEPLNDEQRALQQRAAKAWTRWEGLTSYLIHDPNKLGKFDEDDFSLDFARIENRYFMHGCYLGMKLTDDPESFHGKRDNNFIMENLERIKDIPVAFTHPPTDQVTLPSDADELTQGLFDVGNRSVTYLKPICGHSRTERPNMEALTYIADHAPRMNKADAVAQPQGATEWVRRSGTGDMPAF